VYDKNLNRGIVEFMSEKVNQPRFQRLRDFLTEFYRKPWVGDWPEVPPSGGVTGSSPPPRESADRRAG
jgi:hypothetical protein